MIDMLLPLVIYILVLLALMLTVGFAWFLIIARNISVDYKKTLKNSEPRYNCMGIRYPSKGSSKMPPMKQPHNPHK